MDFTVRFALFIITIIYYLYLKHKLKNNLISRLEIKGKINEKEVYLNTKCSKILNITFFFVAIVFILESILSLELPISFLTFIIISIVIQPVIDINEYIRIDDTKKILINYIFKTPPFLFAFICLFSSLTILLLLNYFCLPLLGEIKNSF